MKPRKSSLQGMSVQRGAINFSVRTRFVEGCTSYPLNTLDMCLIFPMFYFPRIIVEKEREGKKKKKIASSGCLGNYTEKNTPPPKKTHKTTKAFLNLPLMGLSESFYNSGPDKPYVGFLLIGSSALLQPLGEPREKPIRLALDESQYMSTKGYFQTNAKSKEGTNNYVF